MTRARLARIALLLGAALLAAAPRAPAQEPPALRLQLAPHAGGETRCALCHSPQGWSQVRFDHARTGFPLKGRHTGTQCRACHGADINAPRPTACSACHQDVHAGALGARCANCHDEQSWRPLFNADAHRRTNFPLSGRHALIPCQECHVEERDRTFAARAKDCSACHAADYARTGASGLDHAAAGFDTNCKACHSPFSFRHGRFAAHEQCFQISVGPHSRVACLDCHTSLRGAHTDGSCQTNTLACTHCHTEAAMARRHREVKTYQWKDEKCYGCHRITFESARDTAPAPGKRSR